MKNMKSPGNDGFTTEFYKFFWLDVKTILVKTFNESYSEQQFSISQRQGIITCIPKADILVIKGFSFKKNIFVHIIYYWIC
jgi:hypothetical protein